METDRRSLMQMSLAAAALTAVPGGVQAAADPTHDFDFLFGTWNVRHHYLKGRLVNSTEWLEFDGTLVAWPTLGGAGNVDDNIINKPTGTYRAITVRTFDAKTQNWSIWYIDGRSPASLDPPVVGRFVNGIGTFVCDDVQNGKPVKVRYQWFADKPEHPRWEQAFSPDGGATWEVNWRMEYVRTAPYRPAT